MFLKKKFKRKTSLNTSGLKVARLIFIRKTKETAFVGKKTSCNIYSFKTKCTVYKSLTDIFIFKAKCK